ncbi:MAG TPA: hypothetical protein VGI39_18075 [Polyangiaceae bacterium]
MIPLDLLHLVPLPRWSALLRAHGAARAPKTLESTSLALAATPSLAGPLRRLRALYRDPAATSALTEAARVLNVDMRDWPRVATPELIVALLTRAPKDPSCDEVLRAAEFRLCRRDPPAPWRRYHAAVAPPRLASPALEGLAAEVERANAARLAVGPVEVRVTDETERAVTLDVIRPDPALATLVRGDDGALRAQSLVPTAIDRLVIERPKSGPSALWVATAAPELLPVYRAAAGASLFGDPQLFVTSPPVSLAALQRLGEAVLRTARKKSARIRDARAVSLVLDPGYEDTVRLDGRNTFAALEREELPLHGRLIAARLRLDFDDGPVDVTLRVPNVVHWPETLHDEAVRTFLAALALDEAPPEHFPWLAPHDLPAWHWRLAVGDAVFESRLRAGYFSESTSRALAHPDCTAAGRVLLAFKLGANGRYYCVPEEGFDVEARLAGDADLVTYALDRTKLALAIMRDIGSTAEAPRLHERGTLLDLGDVPVGPPPAVLVRPQLVVGVRTIHGLAERLREQSGGAHPLLLVPKGYRVGAGVAEVEVDSVAGPFHSLIGAMAKAIGVKGALGPYARAPQGTRVAVDAESGAVEIDGVRMAALSEGARALVRLLVEAGGAPVPLSICDRRLSARREAAGAAKEAKRRFLACARKSFTLAGREPPPDLDTMIVGTRQGYRLAVKGWIG